MFLSQALRAGLRVSEFWEMTPREVMAAAQATVWRLELDRERMILGAWLTAALSRSRRLPPVKRLLSKPGKTKRLTPAQARKHREEFEALKAQMAQVDLSRRKRK